PGRRRACRPPRAAGAIAERTGRGDAGDEERLYAAVPPPGPHRTADAAPRYGRGARAAGGWVAWRPFPVPGAPGAGTRQGGGAGCGGGAGVAARRTRSRRGGERSAPPGRGRPPQDTAPRRHPPAAGYAVRTERPPAPEPEAERGAARC